MTTNNDNDNAIEIERNDINEYNERVHMLACEIVARCDAFLQRDDNKTLRTLRNACAKYIEHVNTHNV